MPPDNSITAARPKDANTSITVEQLKIAKEGFEKVKEVLQELGGREISLREFASIMQIAKELVERVGGGGTLAQCAEALADLTGSPDCRGKKGR